MANIFQCCKKHTINLDLVCYAVEEDDDTLSISFSNGKKLFLKGKCKELVDQSLALMVYYQKNI